MYHRGLLIVLCLTSIAGAAEPVVEVRPARTDSFSDPLPPWAIARLGTIRWRASGQIQSVSFSPDGKRVVATTAELNLVLFEFPSGRVIGQHPIRNWNGNGHPVFTADGQVVPVTLLKAGPCMVVQRKTPTTDGYDAVQLGLVEFVKPQRINKPTAGRLKKAGVEGAKFMREFRLQPGDDDFKAGDQVLVDQFKPKDKVDVIGVSKGRGFAGLVKRHHFRGGESTHGSMFHRAPGSIGASSYPSRVVPGMRMAGHMGHERVTVRNLEVIEVVAEDNVLVVKGAVPGPNGGYVLVRRSKR